MTPERCSFEDEDGDGENNEGLECTFFAATEDAIWRVDPFAGVVTWDRDADLPGVLEIFDLGMAPDGHLYATAGRKIFRIDATEMVEVLGESESGLQQIPFNPNGLAFDDTGKMYITNHDPLVGSRVVSAPSPLQPPTLLRTLGDYHSSGDCVIDKGALLFTADTQGSSTDVLVRVPWQGTALEVVGDLGWDGVYGLSSAYGYLFGVTHAGAVLRIDSETGSTELLFETGHSFTGAANVR
jgi:hypothetical protein